jgi:Phosphodiester glycosidase
LRIALETVFYESLTNYLYAVDMAQLGRWVLGFMLCCSVALSEPPNPVSAAEPLPNGVPDAPLLEPGPPPSSLPDPLGEPQNSLAPSVQPKPPAEVASSDVVVSNPAKPKPIPTPSPNSVRLESKQVLGVHVKLVVVNLENPKVRVLPVLPLHAFKRGAQFDALVAGSSAVAVLNAGHFHPRTFSPVGDIIYNGRYLAYGRLRTGLAITKDNTVKLWLRPFAPDAKTLETLIGTGPLLVHNRQINPVPKAEGYSDPAIWGSAARTAVGILSSKKLVFVSTRERLSLRELGKVMLKLGSKDAIALDGGSSVGFAWRGQVMIHPKRKIAFGVGVYIRK